MTAFELMAWFGGGLLTMVGVVLLLNRDLLTAPRQTARK
jgi:hypothetical protein